MKATAIIDGYHIELDKEVDYGDGPRSQCFVSRKIGRVEYTASLSALQQEGTLTDVVSGDHTVPEATVDRIVEWAEQNGY